MPQQSLTISPAQLDRVLAPFKVPDRSLKLANQVRTGPWEVDDPGWIEADTVAHCSGSMRGTFVWSLLLTDIATGWTRPERRGIAATASSTPSLPRSKPASPFRSSALIATMAENLSMKF